MSAVSNPQGIDVSLYQGVINWQEVAQDGIAFAIAKATRGNNSVDPKFTTNWSGIKAAGLVRGAYHFFEPGEDATQQAQLYLKTVSFESGDLPPVLDFEKVDKNKKPIPNATLIQDVQTWLDTVEQSVGRRPMIYTGGWIWNPHMNDKFGQYTLWIANWGASKPDLPEGWTTWAFWQYADDGKFNGIVAN